jgi:hypothetical protein
MDGFKGTRSPSLYLYGNHVPAAGEDIVDLGVLSGGLAHPKKEFFTPASPIHEKLLSDKNLGRLAVHEIPGLYSPYGVCIYTHAR